MYSKASSILPTACWTDYVIERIKHLLCQQGNYILKKTTWTFIKSLPKTELRAKIKDDGCMNKLNFKRSFSCKAHSNLSFPSYLPKVSVIFYLITMNTMQPSAANFLSWKSIWVIRGFSRFSFVYVFFLIAPSLLLLRETYFFRYKVCLRLPVATSTDTKETPDVPKPCVKGLSWLLEPWNWGRGNKNHTLSF